MSPSPSEQPDLPVETEVAAQVSSLDLGVDASELHGLLCGHISGGGASSRGDWLGGLLLEGLVDPGTPLDRLHQATAAQLADPDFGFELLLPVEAAPLEARVDALLAWCRGFLGGFGLAAGSSPPLSEESREALDDLGKIAASRLSHDDSEADEEALAEVAEFVRVAALLLHGDCVLGPARRARLH